MSVGKRFVSNRLFKLNVIVVKIKNNKAILLHIFLSFLIYGMVD